MAKIVAYKDYTTKLFHTTSMVRVLFIIKRDWFFKKEYVFYAKYKHVCTLEMEADEILWTTAGVLPKDITLLSNELI